jgi:quinolinate synthase
VQVIAHPECSLGVLEEADMVGSTSGMIRFVAEQRPQRVVMVTECSMSDNVAAEFPDLEFVRPCTICPHMKKITLQKISDSLHRLQHRVEVPHDVAVRARRSVERMLEVGRGARG